MILGVDVHVGYGRIDWARVKAAGVEFSIPRCSEGNEPGRDDPRYIENVAGAINHGIITGPGYHVGWTLPWGNGRPAGRSPKEQATRAFAVANKIQLPLHGLPHVLDLEWPPHWKRDPDGKLIDLWAKWEVTPTLIADWALAYLEEATRLWGRRPILYTYPDYWKNLGDEGKRPEWVEYDLWLARYTHPHVWMPPASYAWQSLGPWERPTLVQFSAEGSPIMVPGIGACPVDRDVFLGSLDDLRRYCGWDPEAETQPEIATSAATYPTVHPTPDTAGDFLARDVSDLDDE